MWAARGASERARSAQQRNRRQQPHTYSTGVHAADATASRNSTLKAWKQNTSLQRATEQNLHTQKQARGVEHLCMSADAWIDKQHPAASGDMRMTAKPLRSSQQMLLV